jgi:crotonobetainyl-CoA:carnitine CoA-transferase CaiB-like acyl-CoA transferase
VSPVLFSRTAPEPGQPGAAPGYETLEVLLEAGFSEAEVDELARAGVLCWG